MDVKQFERFADVIKAVRRERRLSQREMARELKVSAGYVGQWELGLSKPSADVVRRICKTFGISEEEYVLRLAFAESAPEFLRDSIVHYQTAHAETLTPVEQQVLAQLRRLPPADQPMLVDKASGWVDQMLAQKNN